VEAAAMNPIPAVELGGTSPSGRCGLCRTSRALRDDLHHERVRRIELGGGVNLGTVRGIDRDGVHNWNSQLGHEVKCAPASVLR
jgi:hypothetical protein